MMRKVLSGPTVARFFFNDTATTEIYTLSLHDALPISDDDQLQRHMWNQNDGCRRADTRNVRRVEARSLPQFLVERVFPPLDLAISPGAGKRNSGCAQDGCVDHEQQDAIASKMAEHGHDRFGELSRILERYAVLKAIVADQHHGAGYHYGEGGADKRVEPRPLQIGETQPLLCHAALLKKELPGGPGRVR